MSADPVSREAQRRASELQEHLFDAEKAKRLDDEGLLEHAIMAQMLADAIRWGILHEQERRATEDAASDETLEIVPI